MDLLEAVKEAWEKANIERKPGRDNYKDACVTFRHIMEEMAREEAKRREEQERIMATSG